MTKQVRIENADSNPQQAVRVSVYSRSTGTGTRDALVGTNYLYAPTDLAGIALDINTYAVVEVEGVRQPPIPVETASAE